MKLMVCILIMLISAVTGNGLRQDIKRRCESLEALQQICIKLKSEIAFRAPPITELLAKYSEDGKCTSLFQNVAKDMKSGFRASWQKEASRWAKTEGLTQEETETVLLLQALGSTDIDGEKHLLSVVEERLSAHVSDVREELATKGKMMLSCSMLAGLALVIFII